MRRPFVGSRWLAVFWCVVAVACGRAGGNQAGDILAMVGWAFSLAMAGNFPVLVMGVWWKRATTAGAISGMIAGFGLCLFYLVVSRYYPGIGVKYFGMTSLLNPVTGNPIIPNLQPLWRFPTPWKVVANAGASACQQGRLVQPQQHQLRTVGDAARLPGDLCRQPALPRRRRRRCRTSSTRSASRAADGARREDHLTERIRTKSEAGPFGAPFHFAHRRLLPSALPSCWRSWSERVTGVGCRHGARPLS